MKNKKSFIIIALILFIILSVLIIYKYNMNSKFSLDNEYYKNGEYLEVDNKDIDKLINEKKNFVLFTHNNYCNLAVPCDEVFLSVMKKNKIDVLKIKFSDFKETSLYEKIKLAPSVIIIKNGKIVDYLKADKDEDLDKYQKEDVFENWLKEYIRI